MNSLLASFVYACFKVTRIWVNPWERRRFRLPQVTGEVDKLLRPKHWGRGSRRVVEILKGVHLLIITTLLLQVLRFITESEVFVVSISIRNILTYEQFVDILFSIFIWYQNLSTTNIAQPSCFRYWGSFSRYGYWMDCIGILPNMASVVITRFESGSV